jgi:hypothetical protein
MNTIHYHIIKSKIFSYGASLLVISSVFLLSGCAIDFSKYGEYQRRWEVTVMFEKDNLPKDYAYYYAHTFSDPEALIGIEPAYTLDNHLWTRFDPTRLKRLMDNMGIRDGYYGAHFYGSHILDPTGKSIGIYYSGRTGGHIFMEAGNQVNVNLPKRKQRRDD